MPVRADRSLSESMPKFTLDTSVVTRLATSRNTLAIAWTPSTNSLPSSMPARIFVLRASDSRLVSAFLALSLVLSRSRWAFSRARLYVSCEMRPARNWSLSSSTAWVYRSCGLMFARVISDARCRSFVSFSISLPRLAYASANCLALISPPCSCVTRASKLAAAAR